MFAPFGTSGDRALQESDAALVRLAVQGDAEAFQTLVQPHVLGLFHLAYALVGNRADAEDVLQEALLGAYRSLPSFAGRSSIRTWLGQILVRQAALIRRQRRGHVSLENAQLTPAPPSASDPGSSVIREDLLQKLQQLSPEHRSVLVLREFEQLSYEEIAATLQVPRGTVESRLHRARQELRHLLQDYAP